MVAKGVNQKRQGRAGRRDRRPRPGRISAGPGWPGGGEAARWEPEATGAGLADVAVVVPG